MHIKKLEISGFKSFRNKTALELDPADITGIVGPNGCGKSNIVDAIIWVMGESAPKRLRGESLSDVIFSGSGKQPPGQLAEVSMTLSKGEAGFPEKYKGFSELMITRRAFRSGQTEYMINGQPALLRDIKEIFINTGAGCRGFSIIEQEAIEKLITAKPHERRFLIEEAAGIAKFKARKEESLRKLEQVRQNMRRLDDILKMQQKQLEGLSSQAKKAERYRSLKKDIKSREIEVLCRLYDQITEEQKGIRESIALQKKQKERLENEIVRRERDLKTAEAEILKEESGLETEKSYLSELSGKIIERKKEAEKHEGNIEIHRESLMRMEAAQKGAQAKIDSWARQISQISESKKQLQKREWAARRELKNLEAFLKEGWSGAAVGRQRADLEKRIQKIAAEKRDKSAALQVAESRAQMADREREKLLADKKALESRLKKALRDKAKTASLLEKGRQMSFSFQRESSGLEESGKALEKKARTLEKELGALNQQIVILERGRSGQQKLMGQFMEMEEGASHLVSWRPEEFKPLFQSLRVEPGFEKALAAVLGRQAQTLIPSDSSAIERGLKRLKESQKGRAAFVSPLPAESRLFISKEEMQKYPAFVCWLNEKIRFTLETEILKPLTSQTAIVSDLPSAFELKARFPSVQFVTKEGDLITRESMVCGGSSEKEISLFQIKNEIERQSRGIRSARAAREIKKSEGGRAARQLRQISKERDRAMARSRQSAEDMALQKKDLEQLQKDILRLTEEKSLCQKRCGAFEEEKSDLLRQRRALRERLKKLEKAEGEKRDHLKILQGQEDRRRGKERQKADLEMEIFKNSKEQQGLDHKSQLLFSLIEQSRPEIEKAAAGQKALTEKIQKEKILIDEVQRERELFLEEKDHISQALAALKKEEEAKKALRAGCQAALDSLRGRLSRSELEQSSLQAELEKADLQKQNIKGKLHESCQFQIGETPFIPKHGDTPTDKLKEELEKLQGRLETISEVNLVALKEHEELSEKSLFLSGQKDDLISSQKELSGVISHIDRLCEKRFKAVLETVSARFSRIFPILFEGEGAEARLILLEGGDQEGGGEPGVDILIRPPGKKPLSAAQLSRGEKALASICLIYALFLAKPPPFCIIDEIDAPLDDANVLRLISVLREMSLRSQVVTVTHNKRTMQSCQKLYGVTMREPGVSQLVSVNLQQAKRGAAADEADKAAADETAAAEAAAEAAAFSDEPSPGI